MEIFNPEIKKNLLESIEGIRRAIPLMDMDDRDFVASLLYKMAQVVREHGSSHGVDINPYRKFITREQATDMVNTGDYKFTALPDGSVRLDKLAPEEKPIRLENKFARFEVGGRHAGKMYEASVWSAFREVVDRNKKAVSGVKLDEGDIAKVIFNPPATVVYWKDGSKTVVKCSNQDLADGRMTPETGLVYAIAKKVLGNKGNYNDVLRRLVARGMKG